MKVQRAEDGYALTEETERRAYPDSSWRFTACAGAVNYSDMEVNYEDWNRCKYFTGQTP